MKKTSSMSTNLLAGLSGIALLLSAVACGNKPDPTPEEVAKEKEAQIKEILMKKDKKAEFSVEASYGNCKVGYMTWYESSDRNYPTGMRAVVCEDKATTSIQYRAGKSNVQQLTIGYSKEELEAAIKEKEEKEKAEALEKLTDHEKEMLGLK